MVSLLAPKNNSLRGSTFASPALRTTSVIAFISFILGALIALFGQDILAFASLRALALLSVDKGLLSFRSLLSLGV